MRHILFGVEDEECQDDAIRNSSVCDMLCYDAATYSL